MTTTEATTEATTNDRNTDTDNGLTTIVVDSYKVDKDGNTIVDDKADRSSLIIQAGASSEDVETIRATIDCSKRDRASLGAINAGQLSAAVIFARMLLAKDNPQRLPYLTKPNGRALPEQAIWQVICGNPHADNTARSKAKSAGGYVLTNPRAEDIGSIESVNKLAGDLKKAKKAGEDPEHVHELQQEALGLGILEDASSGAEAVRMIREHVAKSSDTVEAIQNRSDAKSQEKEQREKYGRLLAKGDPAAMAEGVLSVITSKDRHAFTLALAQAGTDRADEAVQEWVSELIQAMKDIVAG